MVHQVVITNVDQHLNLMSVVSVMVMEAHALINLRVLPMMLQMTSTDFNLM